MYPILFRIGSRIVSSYTVALVLGTVVGVYVSYRAAARRIERPGVVLDAGFWALLGGTLGGRIGYVLLNWAYYRDHLDKALRLGEGGLLWHSALVGGCVAVGLWLLARRRWSPTAPDIRDLADVAAPGLAAGGAFGWLGCLLIGSAYGAEASGFAPPLSWAAANLPDIYGVRAVRFATQPAMIAFCLALWGALEIWGRRLAPGVSFEVYLASYALADLVIVSLRGDGTWRVGLWLLQWADLGLLFAALGWLLFVWRWSGRLSVGRRLEVQPP